MSSNIFISVDFFIRLLKNDYLLKSYSLNFSLSVSNYKHRNLPLYRIKLIIRYTIQGIREKQNDTSWLCLFFYANELVKGCTAFFEATRDVVKKRSICTGQGHSNASSFLAIFQLRVSVRRLGPTLIQSPCDKIRKEEIFCH